MTAEQVRLEEAQEKKAPWKKWGPYLSERQWGTVREDYSEGGDAWNYFTHDQARSRAYRWGEDGLAGISDDQQRLCFALALWNGKDAILKERLFGLTNSESNHGEDVKEYYFYLDSTPTHSYMKYLYKYPQAAFPYANLVQTNRARSRNEYEYELLDTGVFAQDRYFDVFVEYAKDSAEDILIQITVHNRGPEAAELHVLPTLWFRNQWSWLGKSVRPSLQNLPGKQSQVKAVDPKLGVRYLCCEGAVPLLFTENETNTERVFGVPNLSPYVKDGINNFIVNGQAGAVNPEQIGTKVAAHYRLTVKPGSAEVIRLRLSPIAPSVSASPFSDFDDVLAIRHKEADEFYAAITPKSLTEGDLGRQFYIRQLKDMKIKMLVDVFTQSVMLQYAELCGWTLTHAHARSGEPAKISGYLGKGDTFDRAIADFAIAYADQSEQDHEVLMKAVRAGKLEVFVEQEV